MTPVAHCPQHPSALAGWECEACGPRCPDCVGLQKAGTSTLAVCTGCGGSVRTLTRHRATGSLLDDLPGIFLFPFSGLNPLVIAVLGLGVGLFNLAGFLGSLLAYATQWALVFELVRQAAHGSKALEAPEVGDFFGDLVTPALQAIAAGAVPFLPLLAYCAFGAHQAFIDHTNPVEWLLAALGAAYLPLTLIIAATGTHLGQMFNVLGAGAVVRAIGRDYGLAAVVVLAMGLAEVLVHGAAIQLPGLVLPWFVASATALFAPVILGRTLGMVLYRHGDQVGYGRPIDFQVPLLADAPRGEWKPPEVEPQRPRVIEPIELVEGAEAIARALAAGDADLAVSLFREGHFRPGEVPPDQLLVIGQRASGLGDYPLSLRIFDSVILMNGAHPLAAKALVISARIHAERLRDPVTAAQLYQRVVDRFPDTEAARFASARLAETPRG